MNKLLAINHAMICDPVLDPVLFQINQQDRRMLSYFCHMSRSMYSNQIGLMVRGGTNMLPFKNEILPLVDAVMPEYDPDFDMTWRDITDLRALELEKLIDRGLRLVIFWSGGIDSTCVLTAVLKNFQRHNLQRVIVACTWGAVAENPVFYHRHVKPNFTTVDPDWFIDNWFITQPDLVVVEGFGADTLTMSMPPGVETVMAVRNAELLCCDWRQPDKLLDYMTRICGSQEFAHWLYEKNRISVESIDVPIETYHDFLWWMSFNCEYYLWTLHVWFFYYHCKNISYQQYKSHTMGWYRTNHYQLWAMRNNGAGAKHGQDLAGFKRDLKDYIYEFDHNEFYWRYKTKILSQGRNKHTAIQNPFAITDGFEVLYLEKDLEEILRLLPTHLRP